MPALVPGPGGGAYRGSDELKLESEKFKVGPCGECKWQIKTDLDENPIGVIRGNLAGE